MNNTATETQSDELVFEDEEVTVPESGGDFPTIPAGVYNAKLVGFKREPKPDWKLKGDEDENGKQQFAWTWEIVEGEYAGTHISDWTNISWHEKSNSHKYGAALMGVPTLPVGVGLSTKQFAGRLCQLWIVEVPTKKDATIFRNYVDKVLPAPTPRLRPHKPTEQRQREAVPRQQLAGYPTDGSDEVEEF